MGARQLLRWIVATAIEWVTTQDAPHASEHTRYGTVLANRFDGVLAASWLKPAILAQQR